MRAERGNGPWRRLVVDDGDRAASEGTLLPVAGGWCLARDGAVVLTEEGRVTSVWAGVELDLPDGPAGLERRRVAVTGTWRRRRLLVDVMEPDRRDPSLLDLDQEDPVDVVPDRPGRPLVSSAAAHAALGTAPGRPLPVLDLPAAERALLDAGVLQRAVSPATPDSPPLAIVASPEAGRTVRAALAGVHGPDLRIVITPWGWETVDALTSLLAEDESLVCSVGASIGADHVTRATGMLLHLPSTLAARLAAFPPDALLLDVLVRPALSGPPTAPTGPAGPAAT